MRYQKIPHCPRPGWGRRAGDWSRRPRGAPSPPTSPASQERVQFPASSHLSGGGEPRRDKEAARQAGGAGGPATRKPRAASWESWHSLLRFLSRGSGPCRRLLHSLKDGFAPRPAACGPLSGSASRCCPRPRPAGGRPRAPSAGRALNCETRVRDHTRRWPPMRPCCKPPRLVGPAPGYTLGPPGRAAVKPLQACSPAPLGKRNKKLYEGLNTHPGDGCLGRTV